jgi:hypothetical protein
MLRKVMESNDYLSIPLVDLLTTVEAEYERYLIILLAMFPKVVISRVNIYKPEVCVFACTCWNNVLKRRNEIMQSSTNKACMIAGRIILETDPIIFEKSALDFLFLNAQRNLFNSINNIISNLQGMQVVRKVVDIIQIEKILVNTIGDIVRK